MDPGKSPAPAELGEAEDSPFIGERGETSDATSPTDAAQRWADFESPFGATMERHGETPSIVGTEEESESPALILSYLEAEHYEPHATEWSPEFSAEEPEYLTGSDYGEDELELLHEQPPEERFDMSAIPKDVSDALSKKDWPLALQLAIQAGSRDEIELTNLIFFARHPELPNQPLDKKDPNFNHLSLDWTKILRREVRPAIQKASEDTNLKVSGKYVAERDPQFSGKTGKKYKELAEWAASEADINPGLLAATVLAEWDERALYLSSGEVRSFVSGTDDFFAQRKQLAANVPAFSKVSFDATRITTNINEHGRAVTTIPFKSGKDAALATAVYLKYAEIKLRRAAQKNGGDFDKLPVETRFALVRIAMTAGHGGISPDGEFRRFRKKDDIWVQVKKGEKEKGGVLLGVASRLARVLKGEDILVRKHEPRKYPSNGHITNRNATIVAAQAMHLSDWFFGVPLAASVQPELEGFEDAEDPYERPHHFNSAATAPGVRRNPHRQWQMGRSGHPLSRSRPREDDRTVDPGKSPAPAGLGEAEDSPFIGEIGENSDATWPTEAAQRWADFESPFGATMERSRGLEAELAMQVEEVDPLEEDEPTRWLGTPEQIAFRDRVLQAHTEASRRRRGAPIADLADTDQAPVTGTGICMGRDAAAAAERLLSAARAALSEAQRNGHADALKTLGIGASSGYRNRAHQERLWKGYFDGSMRKPKGYYDETAAVRATLPGGEHGDAAVDYMLRTFRIPDRIAAPGYSNHQAGLAIDLLQKRVKGERVFNSTSKRSVQKWESTWLFEWLLANAGTFGFERYHKEPWHWTYRSANAESTDEDWTYEEAVGQPHWQPHPSTLEAPASDAESKVVAGTVRAGGELTVPRVHMLAGHRGSRPDLILRWNVSSAPEVIDVVVHLHGYWYPGMELARDIQPVSGLDLAPVGDATGQGRSRPTLTVLPKGHDTGVKQGRKRDGRYNVFRFPRLVTKDGLTDLARFSLDRFTAEVGGAAPRVGRLILTAHSGGGAALLQILKYCDPHQVHVFDALYQDAGALADWARRRIRQDRAALQAEGAQSAREYMSTRGGALRVFYGGGTRPYSRKLRAEISSELGSELEAWYRVEASRYGHFQIPRRYGWRVLADASADVPDAYIEPATHREVDLEDGDVEESPVEAAPFDEWEESELWDAQAVSEDFEEAEDPELVAATVAYEAQSAAVEVSDLVGLEVEDLARTDELYESEDPLGSEELFESEEFARGRVSGPPLWLSPGCVQKLKGLSVAVVGGGFAGLMAARTLCRQGMKVTVFEARAQVGGRVLSDRKFSRGRITEVGAELVGSIHTRWCELAIEYGLALISRMDADLYRGQGLDLKLTLDKPLSNDEINALGIEMEDRVLRPIAQLASTIGDPSQPWLDHGLRKYDNTSVADELANRYGVKRTERLWKAMEMLLVNNNVARLEELNFLGLLCLVKGGQSGTIRDPLMGYWNELEIYRCADGCQQLAIKIAKEIQTRYRGKVLCQRAITHIDLSKGVSLASKIARRDGNLEDGKPSIERFDYVILAIPPSVWADVNITPVHPKEFGLMGMGNAVKFFSDVKDRFWIRDKAAPNGGSLTLGQVWEGTDNQTCVGDQGIVLSVFAGARSPTPDQKDQFKRELTKLYPNYPRHLNNTMFANWPKEPFIRTGYASPKLRQIFTVGKALNEPFRGRLFFAGEHTQMDHFGYMEGALRSGERAAQLMMQHVCELPPVLVASRT